ncbi:MAG: glycerophosphodiester phosphodiesterase family protein [Pseudosphingobacterium sp.]|nr:glycerophosphodiester phosphodiesterase family protein [Olivibacter sp. UJ_SKK_5.1]MDX3914686.1 glycerophosphodiester phosphodiesterase family protein [Pseudosphingobacterium sp.]
MLLGVIWITILVIPAKAKQEIDTTQYHLIAHRGGVVDATSPENSLQALEKAIAAGYWMVEVDLRVTADNVLIVNHDPTFNRYFGVDRKVSDMTWHEISRLTSNAGTKVLTFKELLQHCQGKIGVMIDNKIRGNDTLLFHKVIDLLKQYKLYDQALMIGTEESTPFFTGKIKLSCTRKQLEENMKKSNYNPAHYYLFSGNLSREDVLWAQQHDILTIGVINAWGMKTTDVMTKAREQAKKFIAAGVKNFQIDSIFAEFLE